MQCKLLNCQTVPLFHNRKAPSDPTEQVNEIARETTFIPDGHETLIFCELPTPSFLDKLEGIFELTPAFCED